MDLILARGMRHAESDELTFLWGGRVMQSTLSEFWLFQHLSFYFTPLLINKQLTHLFLNWSLLTATCSGVGLRHLQRVRDFFLANKWLQHIDSEITVFTHNSHFLVPDMHRLPFSWTQRILEVLSLGEFWNLSKGTGLKWLGHQIMGHGGPVQKADVPWNLKGSNPFTILFFTWRTYANRMP